MTRALDATDAHPLAHLEEMIVRVTTAVALAFLSLLVVVGLASGESHYLVEALNPAVAGAVGVWLLWRRTPGMGVSCRTGT